MHYRLVTLALFLSVAACSSLPSAGPSADQVVRNGDNELERRYVVADVDEHALAVLNRRSAMSFHARFGDYRPRPEYRLGVGDTVNLQIFEAAPNGLFSSPAVTPSRSGNANSNSSSSSSSNAPPPSFDPQTGASSVLIPEQVVQSDGTISVPFVGRTRVSGMSLHDVQTMLEARLVGKAIEPQVIARLTGNRSNTVTVTGEATGGARLPLTEGGDRILDVVAEVGGVPATAAGGGIHDAYVRLTRGMATATVPMETILADKRENIFVRPNDIITVVHEARTFTALGALGKNDVIPFDRLAMTLNEAVAKASGLDDNRSDPDGVFLLRFETPEIVRDLVPSRPIDRRERLVPVVYRLGLRDAKSLFLARSFQMRDKDIVYVADASSLELQKFLAIATLFITPASSLISSVQTARDALSASEVTNNAINASIAAAPVATPAAPVSR